jgi:coenzyme PQQ synthesis protein D (PqqD)
VNITDETTVVVTGDVLATEFEDELVVLNLQDGVYYGLDHAGVRIWQLLQKPSRVADLRNVLLTEYDVDSERCHRDLVALLSDLATRGLVEIKCP